MCAADNMKMNITLSCRHLVMRRPSLYIVQPEKEQVAAGVENCKESVANVTDLKPENSFEAQEATKNEFPCHLRNQIASILHSIFLKAYCTKFHS